MIVILLDAMVIRDKNEYRVRPVNIYPIKSKYLSNKSVLIAQRVKNLHARQETGYTGSISGLGRSPGGGGHGTPLQYSCLENPMDSGAFGLQLKGSQRVRHN